MVSKKRETAMTIYRAMSDEEKVDTLKYNNLRFIKRFKFFSPSLSFVLYRVMDGKFNNSKFKNNYNNLLAFELLEKDKKFFDKVGNRELMLDRRKSHLFRFQNIREVFMDNPNLEQIKNTLEFINSMQESLEKFIKKNKEEKEKLKNELCTDIYKEERSRHIDGMNEGATACLRYLEFNLEVLENKTKWDEISQENLLSKNKKLTVELANKDKEINKLENKLEEIERIIDRSW